MPRRSVRLFALVRTAATRTALGEALHRRLVMLLPRVLPAWMALTQALAGYRMQRRMSTVVVAWTALALAACGGLAGDQTARGGWHRPVAHRSGAGGQAKILDPSPTRPGSPSPSPAGSPTPAPPSPPGPPRRPGTPGPALPAGAGVLRTTGSAGVALTFDDGPGAYTTQILGLLRQYNVKATFCLVGVNVRANPGLVQAIVRDGHTLCNHTWYHDLQLGTRSAETIRADLQRTNDEIHRAVPGVPIRYFRHPGGNFTPAAVAVARQLGMASIGWAVDPSDWNTKLYPVGSVMTSHIIGNVEANTRPGSIVLSHDAGGDRSSTVAAYRTLLPWLLARFQLIALPT